MREIEVKDDVYNKYGKLLIAKGVKIHLDDEKELKYSELGILEQLSAHQKKYNDQEFAKEHIVEVLHDLKKKRIKCKSYSLISHATDILQEIIIESKNSNIGIYLDILSREDLSWIYSHSIDVSLLTIMAALHLKMDLKHVYNFGKCTMAHDIGMTLIPKSIMNKTAKLSDTEFVVVTNHCHLGLALLKELGASCDLKVIMQHHERLDGSGYPLGLKGDEISLESRIVMIADIIDSATTDRPHRPGKTIGEVFCEIKRDIDKYDASIVSVFEDFLDY